MPDDALAAAPDGHPMGQAGVRLVREAKRAAEIAVEPPATVEICRG